MEAKCPVEQINMRFDESEIQDAWNRGKIAGECWKERAELGDLINPHPTFLHLSNWIDVKKVSCFQNRKSRRLT